MKKQLLFIALIVALLLPWAASAQCTIPVSAGSPYTEDFESVSSSPYDSAGSLPSCWTGYSNVSNTAYVPHVTDSGIYSYCSSGRKAITMTSGSSTYGSTKYVVLPEFTLAVNQLQLSFWMCTESSTNGVLSVGYLTSDSDTSTFVPVESFAASSATVHSGNGIQNANHGVVCEVAFAGIPANAARIAFKWVYTTSYYSCCIDDVIVETLPTCPRPTQLLASNITPSSVSLGWLGTASSYVVEYSDTPFTPGTGTGTVVTAYDTNITLMGLNANTVYYVAVQADCGSGDTSRNATTTFRTACGLLSSLPFTEDFEQHPAGSSSTGSNFVPCWNRLNNGTTYGGHPYVSASYNHTPGGSMGLYWYNATTTGTYGDYQCVVLPPADPDIYPVNTLQLNFYAKATSTSYHPVIEVGVMTDPDDITTFQSVTTLHIESTEWTLFECPLGAYTGSGNYVAIKATRPSSYWYIAVDDITLREAPSCFHINNLSFEAATTSHARISWTIGNPLNYSGASIDIKESGDSWEQAVNYTETDNLFYVISGLNASTSYDVRVAALCNSELSEYDSITFTTAGFSCAVIDPDNSFADTIGNGGSTNYTLPVNNYYNYSFTEQLFLASELNVAGSLSGLSFDYAYSSASTSKTDCKIYVASTSLTSLSTSSFVQPEDMTLVYEGPMNCSNGWNTFTFNRGTFNYDGTNNLLIAVLDNSGDYDGMNYKFSTHSASGKAVGHQNDSSPFSGTCANTYSYRSDVIFNFQECLTPSTCSAPVLSLDYVGPDTVSISWLPGASESSWNLYANGALVASTSSPQYDFDALTPNTDYTFRVEPVCGDGDTLFAEISARTACVYLTSLPFTENFEQQPIGTSSTSSAFITCWNRLNNGTSYGGYPYVSGTSSYNYTPGGTKGLYWCSSTTTGTYGDYQCIVLPAADPALYPVNTLQLSFYAKATSSSYHPVFEVGVMTDPDDINSFQSVITVNIEGDEWTEYECPLSDYAGNGRYVAIKATRPASSWYAALDDITLGNIPVCPKTSVPAVTLVSTTSITLEWIEYGSATSWSIEYDSVNFTPGTGSATSVIANDTNYTITGLDSATTYYIYLHAICGGGDTSYNRFVSASTLLASPAELPYSCDFEQEGCNGWNLINGTQTNAWCVGTAAHNGPGNHGLYISNNGGLSNEYTNNTISYTMAFRTLNIPDTGEYVYSIDWKGMGESHYYDFTRAFLAPVSYEWTAGVIPGGATYGFSTYQAPTDWIDLSNTGSTPNTMSQQESWTTMTGTFRLHTPGTYNLVFAWANDASGGSNPPTAIDNVSLFQNTCPQIQNLHVTYVASDTVILGWVAGGTESEWTIFDGTNQVSAYDTTYTFDNLSPNTSYTFTVRGICGDGDTSMASTISLRTACATLTSFPWSDNFDSYTANALAPCWDNAASTTSTLNTTPYYVWGVYNNGGNNMLRMYNSLVQSGATYMKSPVLSIPEDGSAYELDFLYSHRASSDPLTVSVITADSVHELATLSSTGSTNTTDPGEFVEAIYSLANYAGQDIQIQFFNQANYGSGAIFVDNVSINRASSCPRVENLSVAYSNGDTISLLWNDNGEANFQIAYGPAGFNPDTVQYNMVNVSFDTAYTFTGLPLGVTYEFYVRTDCGVEQGVWRGPVSAMTGFFYQMSASGIDTLRNACGYIITDDGGPMGTYSTNSDATLVVLPSNNGETLVVSGHSFTESSYDYITIYDGTGTAGTVLYTDYGINQDTPFGPFTSEEGAVTITFHSDGSIVKDGWEIAVQCIPLSGCLRPAQLSVLSLDNQNATIDWVERGTANSWNIQYGPAGFSLGSASAVSVTTNSHPFTISNLTPATAYDVYVMADCGGDTSLWSAPLQFTTLTVMPATLPFSCDFTDTIPNCGFELVNGSQNNKWVVGSAESNGTPQSLYISNNNGTSNAYTNNSTNISYAYRTLQIQGGEYSYSYDWKAYGEGNYDYLRVWLTPASAQFTAGLLPDGSTSTYNYTTSSPAGWYPLDGGSKLNLQDAWQNRADVVTLPAGTYHLVFMWGNDGSSGSNPPAAIDNVFFAENTCPRPANIALSNISQTGVTISWSETGSASAWQYQLDTLPITNAIDTFCSLTNLNANTPYTFRVRAVCGGGDTSFWTTFSFRTPCGFIALPFSEDFETVTTGSSSSGSSFVDCWVRLNNGSSYGGYPYVSSSSSYNHTTGGSKGLYWYNSTTTTGYGDYQCIALPPVDASTPINTLQLSFWAKSSSSSYSPSFQVGVMTNPNDISSFVGLDTINSLGTSWQQFEVPLDAYLGLGQYVAIKADRPSSSWYAYVDDIILDLIPSCPKVSNLSMISSNASSMVIDWTDHALSTPEWQISYTPASGPTSTVTVYSHPATISGLSSSTSYQVSVRPICGPADTGYWCDPQNFSTNICDNAVVISTGSSTSTSNVAPVDNYYNYSLTETIIDSAELNGPQSISAISYYFDYTSPSTAKTDVDIYLQPTTKSSFISSSDMVALNTSTAVLVYSGNLNCSQGWNLFTFDTPYEYDGTGNLLVIVDDNSGDYDGSAYVFATAPCSDSKTIAYYDDSSNPDVSNPSSFSGYNTNVYSWRPALQLISCGSSSCHAPAIASVSHDYQSATVSWSGNGSSYQVSIRRASQGDYPTPVSVNATSYSFTGLQPATLYFYHIRQDCTADSNDYSNWVEGHFTTDSMPCLNPTDFRLTGATNATASFAWTNGSTETAWEIHIFRSNLDTLVEVYTNPATVGGLTVGLTYSAAIRALCGNAHNIQGPWSDTIQFTTAVCDPVSNVTATANGRNITVSWTPGSNNCGNFEIDYGYAGSGQGEGLGTLVVSGNAYTFNGLEEETTFRFAVRAICGEGWLSTWSNIVSATTGTGEGIYDVEGNFNCTISPNPATDETTISVTGVNGKVTIAVVDLNGRTVFSETLECAADCVKKVNVSNLTQGAYFVRIFGDNVNSVKKLIVR